MVSVQVKSINKTFNRNSTNKVVALNDVSLSVSQGEILFVLGTNGSGKTTLLNIINGEIKPDVGEVNVNGKSINTYSINEKAKLFGRLYQNPTKSVLTSYSIQENLLISRDKNKVPDPFRFLTTGSTYNEIIKYVDDTAPEFKGQENKLVNELSGGQVQILGILNALISKPQILLLDEFTSSLDFNNAKQVLNLIKKYIDLTGNCAIIVTHNISQAFEFGSNIIILNQGIKILELDPKKSSIDKISQVFYKLDRE